MGSEAQIHIFYAHKASVSPTGQTAAQIGGLKRKKFLWKRLPSDWKVGGRRLRGEKRERAGVRVKDSFHKALKQ